LLEPVRAWWRHATPVTERPAAVFQMEPHAPRVPAEYVPLHTYLERRYASTAVLTFEQLEALLGFALPASARTERDWWTGGIDTHLHAAAWMAAGRTATPNLSARTVTFERSP
jgi:hypothetical protein